MKTTRFSKFGIIFAVVLTMVTTFVFTACNSEDDFGGDLNGNITGQYSLATRMMPRAGENNIKNENFLAIEAGKDTAYSEVDDIKIIVYFEWTEGPTSMSNSPSSASATATLEKTSSGILQYSILSCKGYWIGSSGVEAEIQICKKNLLYGTSEYITTKVSETVNLVYKEPEEETDK